MKYDGVLFLTTVTSDRQHGLEFDCNKEATFIRGERPLIDLAMIANNVVLVEFSYAHSKELFLFPGNKLQTIW